TNGKLRIRDFDKAESLLRMHIQVGVDDCSTDLALRGMPVFQGLIGPMPEGKDVVRYESPDVFEAMTKEWSTAKSARRTRTRKQNMMASVEAVPGFQTSDEPPLGV